MSSIAHVNFILNLSATLGRLYMTFQIRRLLMSISLASVCILVTLSAAAEDTPVWFWGKACGTSKMRLEVTLDGKILHSDTHPICQRQRANMEVNNEKVAFRFKSPRNISTARDELFGVSITKGVIVEANIWHSGAETDAMVLGVSLVAMNYIFVHGHHVALVTEVSESEIERGLIVKTIPLSTPDRK